MRVTFSSCFDEWVCTTIKTGNPRPFQGTLSDQIETTSNNALNPKSAPARLAADLAETFGGAITVMPHVDAVEFSVDLNPTD